MRTKSFNVLVVAATVVTLLPLAAFNIGLLPFGLQVPSHVALALMLGLGFTVYLLIWAIWIVFILYRRKQGGESYP